jgi:hypothetical protein
MYNLGLGHTLVKVRPTLCLGCWRKNSGQRCLELTMVRPLFECIEILPDLHQSHITAYGDLNLIVSIFSLLCPLKKILTHFFVKCNCPSVEESADTTLDN